MHHDEPVALLAEFDRGIVGLAHATLAFMRERHRREREDRRTALGRIAGDHGGSAAAGTTTQASDEHDHGDAGEQATERGFFRFSGSKAQRGFTPGTHPARLRPAELQRGGGAGGQGTCVGVEQRNGDFRRQLRRQSRDHRAPCPTEADQEDGSGRGHLRVGRFP